MNRCHASCHGNKSVGANRTSRWIVVWLDEIELFIGCDKLRGKFVAKRRLPGHISWIVGERRRSRQAGEVFGQPDVGKTASGENRDVECSTQGNHSIIELRANIDVVEDDGVSSLPYVLGGGGADYGVD